MCVVEKRVYVFSSGEREVYEHVKSYCERATRDQPCSSVRVEERTLPGAGHSTRPPRIRLVPDTGVTTSPASESFPPTPTNEPNFVERRPSKSSRNYNHRAINPNDITFRLGGSSNRKDKQKAKEPHRGHHRHTSSGASTLSDFSMDTARTISEPSPLSSTFADAGHNYWPSGSHSHPSYPTVSSSRATATMVPPKPPAAAPAGAPPSGPPRRPVAVATGFPDEDPNRKRKAKDLRPIITGPDQGHHPDASTPAYTAEVRTPRDVPHPVPSKAKPVEDAMSALDLNEGESADAIYARKEAERYAERERQRKQQKEDQWHADYEKQRASAREEARRKSEESRRQEEEARRQQKETRLREEDTARHREEEAAAAARRQAAAAQRQADDWEVEFEARRRAVLEATRMPTEPAPAPAPREEPLPHIQTGPLPRTHQEPPPAATSRPIDEPTSTPFSQQRPEPISVIEEPVRHRPRQEPLGGPSSLHNRTRTNPRPTPSLHNPPLRGAPRDTVAAEKAEREALNRREREQLEWERREADARDFATGRADLEYDNYSHGSGSSVATGSVRGNMARRGGEKPVLHQTPHVGATGAASARGREVVERERQKRRDREREEWYRGR